jgi:ATP-dependent Zn protease
MDGCPVNGREKVAYHEAGHAAVGLHVGIDVRSLTIGTSNNSEVRFSPIGEICDLRRARRSYRLRRAEEYAMFALGGMTAEVILQERRHKPVTTSRKRQRLRSRWEQEVFDENNMDFETAYQYLAAGLKADNTAEVEKHLNRAWKRTREILVEPETWRTVDALARELIAAGTLSEEGVKKLLAS